MESGVSEGRPVDSGSVKVHSRALLGLAGFAVAVSFVLGAPAAAQAHNYLVSSTPADGSTITETPAAFEVTTNDALLELGDDGAFAMEVRDAAGLLYGDGCLTVTGASLSMGATLGEAGPYTVTWQVVSADGHTVSGELAFVWEPPSGAVLTPGSETAPVCGVPVDDPQMPTAEPTANSTPPATSAPSTGDTVDLAPVLWIGGILLVLGVATAITLYLIGRRSP